MPFAPLICKQVLAALTEKIIPQLESVVVTQVSAEPPFYLHGASWRVKRQKPLPARDHSDFDMLIYWPEDYVLAKKMPHIGFLYGGATDERWGITDSMVQTLADSGRSVPAGVIAVRLIAPAICYVPAEIPRTDGKAKERNAYLASYGTPDKFSIDFTSEELFVYQWSKETGSTHHLHIESRQLPQQLQEYATLLRTGQLAQAQRLILDFMLKLAQILARGEVSLSNSSWPPLDESSIVFSETITAANFKICSEAIQYIQLHLNTPLTRDKIAHAIGVSPIHMNRVFKQETKLTVMNFVTQYRLSAARQILCCGHERIGEIASLVGFASMHSMSVVFKRAHGMSPRAYREKMLAAQPAKKQPD